MPTSAHAPREGKDSVLLALAVITAGALVRQSDRLHFARGRPACAGPARLIALQRSRANNLTPALLLAGQWIQITGWWLLAPHHPLAAAVAVFAVAVHVRHLQEISHFAVHGVLARTPRANHLLGEALVHHPLGLGPLPERRRRHVQGHHPRATLDGDPNLTELRAAGLRPGVTKARFTLALARPLTPAGARATAASLTDGILGSPARAAVPAAVLAAAYLAGGWTAVTLGVLVPRLLLYPQLAWISLLAEHTWFDPDHRTGTPAQVEAGRCLRLYPRNRLLAALAAATCLPYGDLHHYAHSAHPAIRWNYLPALERHLPAPHFTPNGFLLGPGSVVRRHHRALTPPARQTGAETT